MLALSWRSVMSSRMFLADGQQTLIPLNPLAPMLAGLFRFRQIISMLPTYPISVAPLSQKKKVKAL